MTERLQQWTCGHKAHAMCSECYRELAIRSTELADEIERLRETLAEIESWCRAYPRSVFPKPDLERAHDLLKAGGMTLDAVSADAMRHVLEGVAKLAKRARTEGCTRN